MARVFLLAQPSRPLAADYLERPPQQIVPVPGLLVPSFLTDIVDQIGVVLPERGARLDGYVLVPVERLPDPKPSRVHPVVLGFGPVGLGETPGIVPLCWLGCRVKWERGWRGPLE